MIEVKGITKRFGSVTAVENVSFAAQSEIFGFLGPNGAGKTTTIRIMTGLLKPDSGTVHLCGRNLESEPVDARRTFGLVPDPPYLYPALRPVEFWRYAGELRRMDKDLVRRRVEMLVDLFDISHLTRRLIRSLSHGEKQLVALGTALLHDPEILVLDEPLSGLDPGNAHIIKQILGQLAGKGKTIFLSTHLLDTADTLCERVGIIHKGSLIALGTLRSLMESGNAESLEEIFLQLTGAGDTARIDSILTDS